ncbi:hypothetical protein ABH853_11370 [Pseudomonas sp. 13.2]|uniref:Methyl-accepting chemotaxis protein n=1 Tax=Pseudomonas sp. 13.2 TaxID=3144665 RepID=A0AAU7BL87_9PSED
MNTNIAGVTQSITALMQNNADNQQSVATEVANAAERTERAIIEAANSNRSELQSGFEGINASLAGVTRGIVALSQGQADGLQAVADQLANAGERTERALIESADSNHAHLEAGFNSLNTGLASVAQSIAVLQQGQADAQQAAANNVANSAERTERALSQLADDNRSTLQSGFEALNGGISDVVRGVTGLQMAKPRASRWLSKSRQSARRSRTPANGASRR